MPREGYKTVTVTDDDYEAAQDLVEAGMADSATDLFRKAIRFADDYYEDETGERAVDPELRKSVEGRLE